MTGALPASGSPVNYRALLSADRVQQLILESRNVTYDEARNLTAMVVRRAATMTPTGGSGPKRSGRGLDTGATVRTIDVDARGVA